MAWLSLPGLQCASAPRCRAGASRPNTIRFGVGPREIYVAVVDRDARDVPADEPRGQCCILQEQRGMPCCEENAVTRQWRRTPCQTEEPHHHHHDDDNNDDDNNNNNNSVGNSSSSNSSNYQDNDDNKGSSTAGAATAATMTTTIKIYNTVKHCRASTFCGITKQQHRIT